MVCAGAGRSSPTTSACSAAFGSELSFCGSSGGTPQGPAPGGLPGGRGAPAAARAGVAWPPEMAGRPHGLGPSDGPSDGLSPPAAHQHRRERDEKRHPAFDRQLPPLRHRVSTQLPEQQRQHDPRDPAAPSSPGAPGRKDGKSQLSALAQPPSPSGGPPAATAARWQPMNLPEPRQRRPQPPKPPPVKAGVPSARELSALPNGRQQAASPRGSVVVEEDDSLFGEGKNHFIQSMTRNFYSKLECALSITLFVNQVCHVPASLTDSWMPCAQSKRHCSSGSCVKAAGNSSSTSTCAQSAVL